jgi:hypothetical protein
MDTLVHLLAWYASMHAVSAALASGVLSAQFGDLVQEIAMFLFTTALVAIAVVLGTVVISWRCIRWLLAREPSASARG